MKKEKIKTRRKAIELPFETIDILSAYSKQNGTSSKPFIEELLIDLAKQIKKKNPSILNQKKLQPVKIDLNGI